VLVRLRFYCAQISNEPGPMQCRSAGLGPALGFRIPVRVIFFIDSARRWLAMR
jgi:hypothetical protein